MRDQCTGCGKQSIGRQKFRREQLFWKRWTHCPQCRLKFESRLSVIIGVAFLCIAVIGVLIVRSGEFSMLGYLCVNAVLFQLFVLFGTLPHEIGHALVGRQVGLLILEISIGRGRDILVLPIAGFRVQIRLYPIGGLVLFGHYSSIPNLRRKYITAVAAGPLTNLALALGALPFAAQSQIGFTTGIPIAGLVVVSQLFITLYNLLPLRFLTARGVMNPSDGLSLYQLFFTKFPEVMGARFEISSTTDSTTTTSTSVVR